MTPVRPPASPWLHRLASLRLTPVLLSLLAAGVVLAHLTESGFAVPVAGALALLAANLGAAIATHPRFRRQTALLVFHLALLAVVLLLAAGRLTTLTGRFELTTGATFDGSLIDVERGPLHFADPARAAFRNDGFTIEYAPGLRRGRTRNEVSWAGADGREQRASVGDHYPLVLAGYRFYTTPNKGFAPVFTWRARRGGDSAAGSVHLPSYPLHEFGQAREWLPPGAAQPVWVMLKVEETLLDPAQPGEFRLPSRHHVVVRAGAVRTELRPGEHAELPEGVLAYEELRTWMGYRVHYDWTLPWLLAASSLAVVALAWHVLQRFARAPAAQVAGATLERHAGEAG